MNGSENALLKIDGFDETFQNDGTDIDQLFSINAKYVTKVSDLEVKEEDLSLHGNTTNM